MQPRAFSTVSLILVAMIFGVVQILCLCAPASAQAMMPASSQTVQGSADMVSDHGHHQTTGDWRLPGDHGNADEHADCDNGVHCDNDAAIASVYPPQSLIAPTSSDPEQVSYVRRSPIPQTRALMAASAVAGLRWLDPPRILSTPVSVKVRFLN